MNTSLGPSAHTRLAAQGLSRKSAHVTAFHLGAPEKAEPGGGAALLCNLGLVRLFTLNSETIVCSGLRS